MSEEAIRIYGREKHFGAATLDRWLAQPLAGREALLELAGGLRLGENQLRSILDNLEDIAARRQCGVAAVLDSAPVRQALSRGLGRNEAIKALKQSLRRLRYPQLTVVEETLAGLVTRLRLPAGVQAEFPENLEGQELSITLRACSATELRVLVAELAEATQRAEIDEIFSLLDGDW